MLVAVELGEQLLSELDLTASVLTEATWKSDLLPQALVDRYAESNTQTVGEYIAENGKASLTPDPADVIAASKWQYGRRPVAVLPIVERVLYRAVVDVISPNLPEIPRGEEAYSAFSRSPIDIQGMNYVLTTDLSNFYSSIPTGRLANELVERTGRWEPIEWLKRFWLSIADGHPGIPQVSQASDLIAGAYADELHRRILRRNLKAWRWSDDFRIATADASAAYAALEIFDEETRKLGLSVNERKTRTQPTAEYQEHLGARARRQLEITRQVVSDIAEFGFDHYEGKAYTPSEAEVRAGAAWEILSYWRTERAASKHSFDAIAQIELASLLGDALGVLAVLQDSVATGDCAEILLSEPQLTPAIAFYLGSVAAKEPDKVRETLSGIIQTVPLTRWQRLWILDLYSKADVAITQIQGDVAAWMRSGLTDSSETMRGVSAWALAMNWELRGEQWNEVSANATRLSSPWLSAALHTALGIRREHHLASLSADLLDRSIYEWVGQWNPFPAPF
jgi:hypothetical protein